MGSNPTPSAIKSTCFLTGVFLVNKKSVYNKKIVTQINQTVYRHLLQTYGHSPGVWFGFLAGAAKPFLLIVITAVVTSQIAASITAGDLQNTKTQILYLFLVNISGVIISAVGEMVSVRAENSVYEKLLVIYYKKLTGKDMAFYRDHQTGYLTSLFRQYLDSSLLLVRLLRGEFMRSFVALVSPVVILSFIDWRLGLMTFAVILIQLAYIAWSSAKANKYRAESNEIYRKLTAEAADSITNIVAYKSGGIEKAGNEKMTKLAREEINTFWHRRKVTALLDMPRGIITAAGICGAFLLIANSAQPGSKSVAVVVLVLSYMLSIIRSVNDLPNIMMQHDDLITKAYPTLKFLTDSNEQIRDPEKPKKLKITTGKIQVKNVSFSYPSNSKNGKQITVFNNLNITINGGESVGIVGLSGAGKSTLVSLLMRFDEVCGGAITIDGFDIRDVSQSNLHQSIAYVPQEPLLFHRTIRENIAYFGKKPTQEQVEKAAKAAHAHNFIIELPDGYDTIVGERGVKLSGGQKQRVVIARAILKNAPIMILDEATSALDTESEKIIQKALPKIIGKQTAVVIAHRLSTIADMDRILVMHAGQVVEEGSHQQLLKQRGRYYGLWQKQIAKNKT